MGKGSLNRNHGLDLLRTLSMMMIVMLHVLEAGGILENTRLFSSNYYIGWLLETVCYGAVNCYGLITGYLSFNATYKIERIILLWLQVIFYSVSITSLFYVFMPSKIGVIQILLSFFPTVTGKYWYFTAYVGLFFLIPFINKLVNSLDSKMTMRLLVTIFVIFSVIPTITYTDIFNTKDGYSTIWLSSLYVIGAIVKKWKLKDKVSNKNILLFIIICNSIVLISKVAQDLVTINLLGDTSGAGLLLKYTSPFVLLSSIFIFMYVLDIQIKNNVAIKIISFFAPVSFGVYLIHAHPLFFNFLIKDRFQNIVGLLPILYLISVIGSVLVIFIICAFVDRLRLFIFDKVNVRSISQKVVEKTKIMLHSVALKIHTTN